MWLSICACATVQADTPLGWMNSDHLSAYTLNARKVDFTASAIAVNESIDFLNVREDLLAGTRQLEGDSGDLDGNRFELQVGITSFLSAFYRRQQQDLTIDLGEISSINLTEIDSGLSTTATAYGLKWNFFEAGHFDDAQSWQAASLELTRTENSTDDFTGALDRITLSGNATVLFTEPQTFRLQDMEDDGWQARFLYSFPLGSKMTTTLWLGYAETSATSGTGSDIKVASLATAFDQSFSVDENQMLVGAGLNWQATPRIPVQLSYEYISITNSDVTTLVNPSNVLLPSFLRANNLGTVDADANHTLQGSISFWITPKFNISLTGKLFSNQFLGVIPHYNNPLSGSFSEQPYGYAGIQLGLQL
jgi:opacity protein-like surface antigen